MTGAAAAPLDHLLGPSAKTTYRRTCTKPPVGDSPFLLRPPDGRAAVDNCNTTPAIAWLSLLRSDIAAGLSHWDITLLAHIRRPFARQKPHLQRGVASATLPAKVIWVSTLLLGIDLLKVGVTRQVYLLNPHLVAIPATLLGEVE